MAELRQIEIGAQLPVETGEQVQVERGGHTFGVVVSAAEHAAVLPEVVADQKAVAFVQEVVEAGEEPDRLRRVEVADA